MEIAIKEQLRSPSNRRELVTVTVTEEDFGKLKAAGGPRPSQICAALNRYLHVMSETGRRSQTNLQGWFRGPVVSFPCALPKSLSDEIRNLAGRFDSHTIDAVRLFFVGTAVGSSDIPPQIHQKPKLSRNSWSTALAALGLVISRVFGQPLFP